MTDYIEHITWRYHAEIAATTEAAEELDAKLDFESQCRERQRNATGATREGS